MSWYAFRLAPQKERRAHDLLTRTGFASIFPHEVMEVRRRRHKRYEIKQRIQPLLHSYAVVQHDGSPEFWHRAFDLCWPFTDQRVLLYVVGTGGRPVAIPDDAIDRLSRMRFYRPIRKPKPILVGDKVTISAGPFIGHTARVEEIRNTRAMVLLSLFGRSTEAKVTLDQLEAA
jgi:transcription antitermination factor NusG